jgi:hypothetical protein
VVFLHAATSQAQTSCSTLVQNLAAHLSSGANGDIPVVWTKTTTLKSEITASWYPTEWNNNRNWISVSTGMWNSCATSGHVCGDVLTAFSVRRIPGTSQGYDNGQRDRHHIELYPSGWVKITLKSWGNAVRWVKGTCEGNVVHGFEYNTGNKVHWTFAFDKTSYPG